MSENDVIKIKIEPIDSNFDEFMYSINTICKTEYGTDNPTNEHEHRHNTNELFRKSVGKFSHYHKHKILNCLLGSTYNSEIFNAIYHNFQLSYNDIFEWLEKGLKEAEDHVHEEIDSVNFNNISDWLEYMKHIPQFQYCCYEPAVLIETIANSEVFPEPSLLDGIDLKSLYRFIYHALLGLPQPQLDTVSSAFLAKEFQNLMDEVIMNVNSDELSWLGEQMRPYFGMKFDIDSTSFDPFNLLSITSCFDD